MKRAYSNIFLVSAFTATLGGCEWIEGLFPPSIDGENFIPDVLEACDYAILASSVATIVFPDAAAYAAAVKGICAEVERARSSESTSAGGTLIVEFNGISYTGVTN